MTWAFVSELAVLAVAVDAPRPNVTEPVAESIASVSSVLVVVAPSATAGTSTPRLMLTLKSRASSVRSLTPMKAARPAEA